MSDDEGGAAGRQQKRARAEAARRAEEVELPPAHGPDQSRAHGYVVLDDLGEMDLRGERWREEAVRQGRRVRQRTR